MVASGDWNDRGPAQSRQIEAYADQVASPDQHVGGASAAAVAAAIAASTAELVVTLTVQGKRSRCHRASVDALDQLRTIRTQLFEAADRDEQVLGVLMDAYKKKSDDLPGLLQSAAETTLDIAGLAAKVTSIAAREAENASRFTVSDLGAAAALAAGSVTAALLTARININMIARSEGGEDLASQLFARADEIEQRAVSASSQALEITNRRIIPPGRTP